MKMNKEERIKRYGEAAYEKKLQQSSDWKLQHRKEVNATSKAGAAANPEKIFTHNQEIGCKGGKYYEKKLVYQTTGIPGEKGIIRAKHGREYHPLKQIISPESQIHHEWIPGTSEYTGVALVETQPHRYGIIDVIKILEGKITLFTEKEIAKGGI